MSHMLGATEQKEKKIDHTTPEILKLSSQIPLKIIEDPKELLFLGIYLSVFIILETKHLKQFMNSLKNKSITCQHM